MTRLQSVLVGLLVLLVQAAAFGQAGTGSADHHSLFASSGRCVGLEPLEARHLAQAKARAELFQQLAQLARERFAVELDSKRLPEQWAWLLEQPGVQSQVKSQLEEKPYGFVARVVIEVSLPERVLVRWGEHLRQDRRRVHLRWLLRGLGTVGVWLLGLGLLVPLDRATGGYHRGVLVAGTLTLLGLLTAGGWWLL